MNDSSTPRSSRRTLFIALGLLVALGALLWFFPAKEAPKTEAAAPQPDAPARKSSPRHATADATQTPKPPAQDSPEPELIVHTAYVEKTEVCRGEENFVVVEASTTNGTDDLVSITVIDPSTGELVRGGRVPFRLQDSTERPIQVVVQGPRSAEEVTLPAVTVKDCDEPVQVRLDIKRTLNALDRVGFNATIDERGGTRVGSFQPYEYEWDFGDGQTLKTATPSVEHSYEGRVQDARQSSFVASVSVRERGGKKAVGSRSVTFSNFGFLALKLEDKVEIHVGADAQGAGPDPERLWLYHGHTQAVRLSQVVMRDVRMPSEGRPAREIARVSYSPAQALGFSEIGPHESRSVTGLPKLAPPQTGVLRYFDVEGTSADGKPARATFTLAARSKPDPTTAVHRPSEEKPNHEDPNTDT